MAHFRFVPDPNAGAEMCRSKGWAIHVAALAAETAEAARAAFEAQGPHPYSDEPEHYVEMIDPDVVMEDGEIAGRVNAHASYSWWIEVGTSDTPAFAPLQKGADAIGLRLEAKPHGRR